MAFNHFLTRVLATLSILYTVLASPAFDTHTDSQNNVTVAINVPSNSTTDLFFHFSAPSQYAWAAFGLGQTMSSSLMFLVYPSANGQNVTVSPRTTNGHSPPQHTDDVEINVLNGSGLQGGMFVVNAHCLKCRTWSTGDIDITSQKQSIMYALGPQSSTPSIMSDSLTSTIKQHSIYVNDGFSLNLKQATGEAGVPNLSANGSTKSGNTTDSGSPAGNTDEDGDQEHDFPIVIHAVMMIGCFTFILPAGYLFLRVFDRVWLHAGLQTFGVVFLIGGIVAGIVCNVQHQLTISYHQVLGILTSLLVFAAFTLGLISHRYFKAHKVSSPLMKFHRMAGPSAIVFGWATTFTGFIYRGSKIYILPYVVVLLAVVIFVGGIAFLINMRKKRQEPMKSAAARNFYEEHAQQPEARQPLPTASYNQGYYAPPNPENMAMQTFSRPFPPQPQHPQAYPYPAPGQQDSYTKKGPDVNVRPVKM